MAAAISPTDVVIYDPTARVVANHSSEDDGGSDGAAALAKVEIEQAWAWVQRMLQQALRMCRDEEVNYMYMMFANMCGEYHRWTDAQVLGIFRAQDLWQPNAVWFGSLAMFIHSPKEPLLHSVEGLRKWKAVVEKDRWHAVYLAILLRDVGFLTALLADKLPHQVVSADISCAWKQGVAKTQLSGWDDAFGGFQCFIGNTHSIHVLSDAVFLSSIDHLIRTNPKEINGSRTSAYVTLLNEAFARASKKFAPMKTSQTNDDDIHTNT